MFDRLNIPQTEIRVSRLAVGGNIFGYFTDTSETGRILDTARNLGINFIDTADVYSDGASESQIGEYLKAHGSEWVIATKVGLPSHASPDGLGKRDSIFRKCEASLKRLNVEAIDLLQMHHFDDETPIEETISALNDLVTTGKIKSYGISNYNASDIKEITTAAQTIPTRACSTIQIPFNVLEQSRYRTLLKTCTDYHIGIMPYNVLARGVLSGKYSIESPPPAGSRAAKSANVKQSLRSNVLQRISEAKSLCEETGITLVQAVVAWTLSQPCVLSLPIGFRSPEQLSSITKLSEIPSPSFLEKLEQTLTDGLSSEETHGLVSPLDRKFD